MNISRRPPASPAATSKSPTRGQVKIPHLTAADTGWLRGSGAFGKTLGGLPHAPALALELQQMTVMDDAVEQRRSDDDVAEELAPVVHLAVRSDDERGLLLAAHQQIGEFIAGVGGEVAQEQIVDDHQLRGIDLCAVLVQLAELARFVDLLQQHVRLAVKDSVAVLHGQLRDGLGAVAFAGAG